jgi:hypothetical protein
MRGGAHEPLSAEALNAKFVDNAKYGGWNDALAHAAQGWFNAAFSASNVEDVTQFRQ